MFACRRRAANRQLDECFSQQIDGKDIFPDATTNDYGADWAQDGSTVRVLRELSYKTFYWMRTSADGRFVANGGGRRRRDGAVIADRAASLATLERPQVRDIAASASTTPTSGPTTRASCSRAANEVLRAEPPRRTPRPRSSASTSRECSKLEHRDRPLPDRRPDDRRQLGQPTTSSSTASARATTPARHASDARHAARGGADSRSQSSHATFAQGNDAESGYQVKAVGRARTRPTAATR